MNNQETTKFEFLLTMDGNIIVQRLFWVRDYNPVAKRSVDLYECVTNICTDIQDDLKKKTFDFMSLNQNFLSYSDGVEEEKDPSNEHFLVEIKLGNDVFIQRTFPAFVYHPKVRYTVDIRPKIKTILTSLTETLSLKSLETSYLQYELGK
jgi:hypothetical protein